MKVVATSDLHGFLPEIPPCDLLILAGDICPVSNHKLPFQDLWLRYTFAPWLRTVPARRVVGTWGNHDLIAEKGAPHLKEWTPLIDELVEFEGLRIWGSPWQRRFFDWAFNLDEPELNLKYQQIPPCDIIISHGPPYGYGDKAQRGELCGSMGLLTRIEEIKPKLVVYGHIHEGSGRWQYGPTTLANVTLVDPKYRPVHPPMEFDL